MTTETLVTAQNFSRFMLQAVDLRKFTRTPTGGQCLFGEPMGNGGGSMFIPDGEVIEIDIRKGSSRNAAYIPRGMVHDVQNRAKYTAGKFTTLARTFPLIADTGVVSQNELLKRCFGEPVYGSTWTQNDRARKNASTIVERILCDHIVTQEISAWQMIKTGKLDLISGATSAQQIDTKRESSHTYTVTASWATAGTKILDSCDLVLNLGQKDAGVAYDTMVVGSDVVGYLWANTEILTVANLKGAGTSGFSIVWFGSNFQPDARYTHMIANGYLPICQLRTKMGRTINVFSYDKTYNNGSTDVYFVTAKEAIFFSSKAQCDRYYGPAEMLPPTDQMVKDLDTLFGWGMGTPSYIPEQVDATPGVVRPDGFFVDVQRGGKNSLYEINVQSTYMQFTTETDAFAYIADVTATS
jgi:hypothetical protein